MSTATGTAAADKRLSLLRVLGPVHVWALGVGIVLVGEYMGWNFSVGKGGMIAGLVACWVAGLLYTSVAMIDSEVTSTVAAAGGQYAQAKHIVGPLMAFNVGLFLVLAYTMLEAGNAITIGYLLDTVAQMQGHTGLNQKPFIILTVMFLAWLNYRGVLVTLNFSFVITAVAFIAILILFFAVEAGVSAIPLDFSAITTEPLPYGWVGVLAALHFGLWYYLASRARPRRRRKCARPRAPSPMARWPASSRW
jgi:ethanolamine permease